MEQNPAARLSSLNTTACTALGSLRMPTTRNEDYRYTDISPLLKSTLTAAPTDAAVDAAFISDLVFPEVEGSTLVMVNGRFRPELSNMGAVPEGVYIGGAEGAPAAAVEQLGVLSNVRGGPFALLNSAVAADALFIVVPKGTRVTSPLYLLNVTTSSSTAVTPESHICSTPRLLVSVAADGEIEVVEEVVSLGASSSSSGASGSSSSSNHVAFAVAEVVLEEGADMKYGYVQREAAGAMHFKSTLVQQAEGSTFKMVEVSVGGSLARHDLGIVQVGPETTTTMRHFLLAGSNQLQDLHSRLVLDHPKGEANQLHKCIVSAPTGRGVFDGNVKVNRFAQKTDAGQLSRNLLLVPKATVNVKPNLQIIADDVKCTHGCAISDLSEEELFYFRARGISAEAARQALVYSFGAEVVQELGYEALSGRIQKDVVAALQPTVVATIGSD